MPSSYDYRFQSQRRDEIIDLIKRLFLIEMKENCPIYHTTNKDLKEFTTTEKDAKKQISRMPTKEYQKFDEDLMKMEQPNLVKQITSDAADGLNNFQEN